MLTYTFSTREKIMLAVLAFVAIIVLWYQLVFVGIQNEIRRIDTEIADVQTEMTTIQSRAGLVKQMNDVIAQYEKDGVKPVLFPDYDNTQNLMAYLNGVLSSTKKYSMSWNKPELNEDNSVHREGSISFECESYEAARSIAQNIEHGPYPCYISALSIKDDSKTGKSSSQTTKAQLEVVFFEHPTEKMQVEKKSNEIEGHDLSMPKDM